MTEVKTGLLSYEQLLEHGFAAKNEGKLDIAEDYFQEAKRVLMHTALEAADLYESALDECQSALGEIENLSSDSFDLHDARRIAQKALAKVEALCL